ncbi:methylated-DNA--[protein]-cysteine S-methyltransferase [Sulfobacillus sp. hq2]|uniref:methylated-DNA--[protein]-cysteine S-methyltransferase n=1 Tax=Sulfobacillus TaxID=28033 RepID=UPI000CD2D65B|nr:methylated-DNA--[protein]-cysteine S-methyltransferase [Sulfobacillus sp. hq2]POB09437.1 cysteine methyltransferase [Sulfobacillus sp. hq2]
MAKHLVQEAVYWSRLDQGDWSLYLAATESGLCAITLPHDTFATLEQWIDAHIPGAVLEHNVIALAPYTTQLQEYFNGQRQHFTCAVDMRGTTFQRRVWNALRDIPFGTVQSYSDIAARIGSPQAVRAVGAANGANPIPIVVPCHRVIGKNRTLTGYRGGLEVKAHLLELEGIAVSLDARR